MERTGPHGACFERLVAKNLQWSPSADDDEKILAVDNGDVDVAWAADRFEPCARQSSHGGEPGAITTCGIHCLGAHDSEPQYFLLPQQPGATPGGEFTNAVASDDYRPVKVRVDHRPGRERLRAAENLANSVGVERCRVCITDELPRIFLFQDSARGLQHALRLRRLRHEVEHAWVLRTLAGAENGYRFEHSIRCRRSRQVISV